MRPVFRRLKRHRITGRLYLVVAQQHLKQPGIGQRRVARIGQTVRQMGCSRAPHVMSLVLAPEPMRHKPCLAGLPLLRCSGLSSTPWSDWQLRPSTDGPSCLPGPRASPVDQDRESQLTSSCHPQVRPSAEFAHHSHQDNRAPSQS